MIVLPTLMEIANIVVHKKADVISIMRTAGFTVADDIEADQLIYLYLDNNTHELIVAPIAELVKETPLNANCHNCVEDNMPVYNAARSRIIDRRKRNNN